VIHSLKTNTEVAKYACHWLTVSLLSSSFRDVYGDILSPLSIPQFVKCEWQFLMPVKRWITPLHKRAHTHTHTHTHTHIYIYIYTGWCRKKVQYEIVLALHFTFCWRHELTDCSPGNESTRISNKISPQGRKKLGNYYSLGRFIYVVFWTQMATLDPCHMR